MARWAIVSAPFNAQRRIVEIFAFSTAFPTPDINTNYSFHTDFRTNSQYPNVQNCNQVSYNQKNNDLVESYQGGKGVDACKSMNGDLKIIFFDGRPDELSSRIALHLLKAYLQDKLGV